LEGQGMIFAKPEFFFEDKEVVRGRDDTIRILGLTLQYRISKTAVN